MEVAIEMTDGLSVAGTPTVVSGRPGDKVPASVSYTSVSDSNGVFNVGTLLGPDHQNAAESTYNSVTLPVEVDSNAVVNGQCLTATLTGNPPPGTGPLDDDISDNVAKVCLGYQPTEPFVSGELEIFTVYDCFATKTYPCDGTDGVRVRAVSNNPRTGIIVAQHNVTVQVQDIQGRTYDSYLKSNRQQSVTGAETVSWQTGSASHANFTGTREGVRIFFSRIPFNGNLGNWVKVAGEHVTVTGLNGGDPPGDMYIRSSVGSAFTQMKSSNDWTATYSGTSSKSDQSAASAWFAEFSKLGTYKVEYTTIGNRDDTNGDCASELLPSGVTAAYCDTKTYTFHVGPIAELAVRDGGSSSDVAADRNALSIVAVNNGPDEPSGGARVTGLPTRAEVIRITQGTYDGSTGVWNTGRLRVRGYYRSAGMSEPTLVLGASAGDTASVRIASAKNYEVCVGPKSNPGNLAHTTKAACEAVTDASWNSVPVYDHKPGNNTAVITAARGAGSVGPGIPGNPRTSTGTTAVMWDPVEYLYGLPVERYEVQWLGSTWTSLARRVADSLHVDTAPSGRRDYRVRAVNAAGVAGPWSRSSAEVQAGHAGPPVNLRAEADGNNAIDVFWDAPEDVGGSAVTGYTVQWSSGGTGNWSNAGATADQTFKQGGLQSGAARWYRVAARNRSGLGLWSDPVMGQTVLGAPDAPRSLSVQAIKAASGDAVWLTWTAPARDNGSPIEGYEVEGSLDGIDWTWLGNTDGKSATDLVDSGSVLWFEPGQTRHYRVRALNEVGDGQWSSTARATAAAVPPEGMSAWPQPNGQNAIDIFWGEPHLKGAPTISSYELQVCVPPKECTALNNDSDYSRVASPSGTTLSYTHTGLQPGDERYYRVRARNSAGWSEWSWPASATTLDLGLDTGLPGAPRLTARANGSAEIKLSWTAADARGSEIESYELEVSDDGLYWDRLAYNWPDQTEFLHDALDGGTRNYYRVRALVLHEGRSIGGQWSTVANATTVAGAPAEPISLSGEGVAQASDDSKHDHVELTLEIRADSTVTRYQVERSVDGGNSGWKQVSVSTSPATAEDCTIDGTQTRCETVTLKDNTSDLYPGTYYYYRAAAANSKGIGPYAYANVLTGGDWVHAPSRPRLLALSNVGGTAATVTWIEPEDDGGVAVTGYEYQLVRICGAGETENCGDWPQDADGFDEVRTTTARSVRLSGLESGGGYHFRVRAVNRAEEITGKGNWSHDIYIDLSAN